MTNIIITKLVDHIIFLQLRELPLRHFNRMFVVVPQGTGFCIVNEMLHVTLPTVKQADVSRSIIAAKISKGVKANLSCVVMSIL